MCVEKSDFEKKWPQEMKTELSNHSVAVEMSEKDSNEFFYLSVRFTQIVSRVIDSLLMSDTLLFTESNQPEIWSRMTVTMCS